MRASLRAGYLGVSYLAFFQLGSIGVLGSNGDPNTLNSFLPFLVAPRRCHLRAVVQMLHPCISFLHKRRDIAVLLQFHTFDAVFRNRPSPVYRRIFRILLFCSWFAESLASARGDVKHAWVFQLGGMVARVYDQSVDGVVLFEARLVALKLAVNLCI